MARTDGKIETMPAGVAASLFGLDSSGLPVLATPGKLPATATNDSASAGQIGEFVQSIIAIGSKIGLVNNAGANITSIQLTAGDWDVTGGISFDITGTTTTSYATGGISLASAVGPSNVGAVTIYHPTNAAEEIVQVAVPTVRVSVAVTTTVYLVAQAGFAVSTFFAYGYLQARRMR